MHVIVTAIGSAGDINPMLMYACELDHRGHEVDFIANGYFEDKVKKAGLNFFALGGADLYLKAVADPELWNPPTAFQAVWRSEKASLQMSVDLIEKHLRPDTVLVGSTLAFGSRMIQEKHHRRGSTIHLAPSCIISACDPMAMPGLPFFPHLPLPVKHLAMSAIDKFWLDQTCLNDLNQIRKQNGLPPTRSVMRQWMHSSDQVIGAFPDWYAKPQPDWPPNIVLTGFPVYDRPEDQTLTLELEAFLRAGEPPVVFTAGSAMAHAKEHFATAMAAAQKIGLRAILVSAFPEQIPQDLPSTILHIQYAPFSMLFPRALMVQHHGGIGTSIQGLAAGVPQLVTPFAHDQFDNAFRLRRLGVARELRNLNHDEWARTLSELKNSKAVELACREAKAQIDKAQSATAIGADAIESLAKTKQL